MYYSKQANRSACKLVWKQAVKEETEAGRQSQEGRLGEAGRHERMTRRIREAESLAQNTDGEWERIGSASGGGAAGVRTHGEKSR